MVHWSRRNILTTIAVIAGLGVIPTVAWLVPGEIATNTQDFTAAAEDDLDPHEPTCLDGVTQVIPAGKMVCATLRGSWLDGIGPQGRGDSEAMAVWTRQAHPPFLVLTSPHPYRRPEPLRENIDFVVCVQPPREAERAKADSNRMRLDVTTTATSGCP